LWVGFVGTNKNSGNLVDKLLGAGRDAENVAVEQDHVRVGLVELLAVEQMDVLHTQVQRQPTRTNHN
jgi:hypothetical protein